jgi:branched-chain amino acid aminotransferase
MLTPELCWRNGKITSLAAAAIHPLDRGFLFGDGLFETLRADAGRVAFAREHLARLRHSAEVFKLAVPDSDSELIAAMHDLLAVNRLMDARLRLTVTRGLHSGNLGLPPAASPTVLLMAEPLAENLRERQTRGVSLALASLRIPRSFLLARHKTLNRLPYLYAREQAQSQGAFDALLLDLQGQVAETTAANLFIVHGRRLLTPTLLAPILPGITRAAVLQLAREKGLAPEERDFPPEKLFAADEVFVTSAIAEVLPVNEVEGKKIGSGAPGPISRELLAAFQAWARSKDPRA